MEEANTQKLVTRARKHIVEERRTLEGPIAQWRQRKVNL